MNKLKKMVMQIRKDNRMSPDDIISKFIDALSDCECGEYVELYTNMYKQAYGDKLTKETAEEWVRSMDVTDDSGRENGMKWTMSQTHDVGVKAGVDFSEMSDVEWFIAMNMAYSDHYKTAKKYGLENDPMYFASVAKDTWCYDKDVHGKSIFSYYFTYVA